MGMGQTDMLLHDGSQLRQPHSLQGSTERRDGSEPPDMLIANAALPWLLSLGIAREERPVILFHVGVVMPTRLQHPSNVALQPSVGIIATSLLYKIEELPGESEIQRVLTCFEKLMVVNPTLPPILCLLPQDVSLLIECLILRTPEDAPGMRILGLKVAIHSPIVSMECRRVVVPMDRHR